MSKERVFTPATRGACLAKVVAILVVGVLSVPALATELGGGISRDTPGRPRGGSRAERGLIPFFNHMGPGADFIQTNWTTRTANDPGIIGQACPFGAGGELTMPPLPGGAVIIGEWVAWNYLLNGAPRPSTGHRTLI